MKKIFILLFVALALISSCDKEEQEVTTELSEAYVGGVGGISFSFIEGAPISELIAGESSLVSILLKNEGEYDLVKDTIALRLWGLDMGAYGLSSEYKLVGSDLRGIKKGLIEEPGDYVMDMGSLEYQGPVVNSLNTKLRSQICYPYKTKANFNLCVSSNSIQNVESEPACSLNGNKIGSGSVSKAPVKLTKVIEQFEKC